jgi:hypothetical protein
VLFRSSRAAPAGDHGKIDAPSGEVARVDPGDGAGSTHGSARRTGSGLWQEPGSSEADADGCCLIHQRRVPRVEAGRPTGVCEARIRSWRNADASPDPGRQSRAHQCERCGTARELIGGPGRGCSVNRSPAVPAQKARAGSGPQRNRALGQRVGRVEQWTPSRASEQPGGHGKQRPPEPSHPGGHTLGNARRHPPRRYFDGNLFDSTRLRSVASPGCNVSDRATRIASVSTRLGSGRQQSTGHTR